MGNAARAFIMAGASGGPELGNNLEEERTAIALLKRDLYLSDDSDMEMEWPTLVGTANVKWQEVANKGNKRRRQLAQQNSGNGSEEVRHKKMNIGSSTRKETLVQNKDQQFSVTGAEQASKMITERKRLYFPGDTQLTYHEQLLWAATLGREHKQFKALLKEGRNRTYLTVEGDEAVQCRI